MRPPVRPALLLLLSIAGTGLQADIYKCKLANGTVEIANTPCPTGSTALTRRPDEPVSAERRKQAEQDVERMRSYVERREALQQAESAEERTSIAERPATVSATPRQYGDPERCLNELSQQALEATQRAMLEAECRSRIKPPDMPPPAPVIVQPGYGGYPGAYPPALPVRPTRPPHEPPPKAAAPAKAFCPPGAAGCR